MDWMEWLFCPVHGVIAWVPLLVPFIVWMKMRIRRQKND